ncbi:hypothetical protein SAV31267_102790 [Streptomyces avermitilis]|uniref:Uncharacterized protein n=1 Tax=Streptomyces avermitilis TaxID=33903 RepID=A0A4D4NA93_STRAX|nr:hypothetical protein SAV31267_102790 [Streptomyces avermitilis]
MDRPLLERYLAHVMSQPGGHGMKKTRIGALNLFFQNIRQYGREDTLSGTAAFYVGDVPPVPEQVDRQRKSRTGSTASNGVLHPWPKDCRRRRPCSRKSSSKADNAASPYARAGAPPCPSPLGPTSLAGT